ncbi:SGNH/GDSL hydrolase family protein [Streptomyces endocoffeicus]|uniref:SGNH/GDSL hydrolase family protein n=1 Tax=Streptomyces endocoffeicus TaxID=2898945 RepID=UPI001E5ABD25|nr:SGNH/GDSL hydrolase family protein [Streptomyces endocoffeicus]
MPLGDSITDGHNAYPGGYRVALRQRLAADGHAVDFVGSLANGPVELGTRHHEGHSGWRIDHLDAHIRTWLRHSVPRTVLLLIGTNDMNQSYDATQAPARLARLIDHIQEARPACEVFVATVPPQSDPTRERRVRAYNAALPEVVAAKGRRVHLVNIYDALTTADLADGLHPNQGGHEKMARVWHSALRSVPAALMPEVAGPEAVRPCSSVGYRQAQRCPE